MAVGRQRSAGNAAALHRIQRAVDVMQQRSGFRRTAIPDEADELVENGRIAGGRQVVPQREQGPVHDVAVGILLAPVHEPAVEVEGLRPVAALVLRGEDPQDQGAQLVVPAQRQQQPDRALADVPGAPAAAGVLLEPARRQIVDHRVVGEPREALLRSGPRCGRRPCPVVRTGRRRPGRPRSPASAGPTADPGCHRRQCGRTVSDHAVIGPVRKVSQGASREPAVDEQRTVVADLRVGTRSCGRILEQHRTVVGPHFEPVVDRAARHGGGCGTVVPEQGEVGRDQQPERSIGPDLDDGDVIGLRRPGRDLDGPPVGDVPPGAAVGLDPPGARRIQAAARPAPARRGGGGVGDEDPEAGRPLQSEVAALHRQHRHPADVALGQLRQELPSHPAGCGDGLLVGLERRAGPDEVTVRPQYRPLLARRHQVGSGPGEGRERLAGRSFLVSRPWTGQGSELGRRQVSGGREGRPVEQGDGDRLSGFGIGGVIRGRRCAGVVHGQACIRSVLRRGGRRVIRYDDPEESGGDGHSGFQADGFVLQADDRVLVLQSLRREFALQIRPPLGDPDRR